LRQPLFEEDQVEINFHQDVFQYFEDHTGETRSHSANIIEPVNPARNDEEISERSKEGDAAMRDELKPHNHDAKVLEGFYRTEGEDFMRDVCSSLDRELIRCLPNLTQQEHTELLLDIFQRRPHLNNISDLVDRIVAKHKDLVL
jgi:predicted ATPase